MLTCEELNVVLPLSYPLPPAVREDFLAAVSSALNGHPTAGPGLAYRTARELLPRFFHPPSDRVTRNNSPRRSTKLINAPAIGRPDERSERRLKVVR